MTGEYCPNCDHPTPRIAYVIIELCTDRECAATGHHVHNASQTEIVCETCDMPFTIANPTGGS